MTQTVLSLSETGVDLLNSALETWNEYYAKVIDLLTTSPDELYPGVWSSMSVINDYLCSIGVVLVLIFFYIGLTKNTLHFEDLRHPEKYFGVFVRLIIAQGLVVYGFNLLFKIMQMFQGCIQQINNLFSIDSSSGKVAELPSSLVDQLLQLNSLESVGILIVASLGAVAIWISSVVILLLVYVRFFKIYIFAAISPLPLATISGESTARTARSFLLNFIAICLQGIVITIALIIFSSIVNTGFTIDNSKSAVSNVFSYIGLTLLQLFLLVATIRGSDMLTKEITGA